MAGRTRLVRLAVCLLVLPALAPVGRADLGGFHIESFDVSLAVRSNAHLDVSERIEIRFNEPRHGIYRSIPVRYTDPRGYAYGLGLTGIDVTDGDGRARGVRVTNEGSYVKIRIGDPDRKVSGRETYVIRYTVRRAVTGFPEHDELYWNVTGHEWRTGIGSASARVTLPGAVEPDAVRAVGFRGPYGSRMTAVDIDRADDGALTFSTGGLAPLEGLTIAVAWPKGLVEHPGPVLRTLTFLVDNAILLAPLGVFAALWLLWRRFGRDPGADPTIVVRYDAPPGLSPGEIGTLVDERADMRDVTATIVDLARRGWLTIRVEEESRFFGLASREVTVFERQSGPPGDELLPHEHGILGGLFESGLVVRESDLENEFYTHLPGIRNALYDRLVATGLFAAHPKKVIRLYLVAAFLCGLAVFLAGIVWADWRGVLAPAKGVMPAIAAAATFLVGAAFARAMPRRTRKGVAARTWALGFAEFVGRVERDRFAEVKTADLFERLLPYAMALGVAAQWARQFDDLYAASGRGGPSWYTGPGGGSFQPSSFQSSVASAMSRTATSLASAPRSSGSSGSGGGGFSGGGGGGGGGGSW